MKLKISYLILLILITLIGCNSDNNKPDASGNFEAIEITVSSLASGRIEKLSIMDGDKLVIGQVVGHIDTVLLAIQLKQILSSIDAMKTKFVSIQSQADVYLQQKESIEKEYVRFKKLYEKGAATEKQVDDIKAQLDLAEKQAASTLTQKSVLEGEIKTQLVQAENLKEQIRRAYIISPISGTVLLKIAEEKEFVTIGMPLFKIANLDKILLRAYVSGDQLQAIKLNDDVEVRIDTPGKNYKSLKGKIIWISSEAEFTPKSIQTKDERINLVYAFKVEVTNNGEIKIGMPGEVYFKK